MDLHPVDSFDTIHNYIDCDNMILRKGSISAQKGEYEKWEDVVKKNEKGETI